MELMTDKAHGFCKWCQNNSPVHPKLCHCSGAQTKLHMYINPVNECRTTFMTA